MPKRLLFVDDEPMVLDGLRRSLHSMRREWQMRFAPSAAAALEALQQEPYDAVVSDMQMPGMDGAELLEQVRQRHPDVVRVILSGQASREAVYRSIDPAHQYLSKPCNLQELISRLGLAFPMRDRLCNPVLKTAISRMHSIPSMPALYDELTNSLHSKDPSLGQIAKIISRDMAMAAKILQLANSAFVGNSGRVSSVPQALSLIGTETLRTLVLSLRVFSPFDGSAEVAASLLAIWNHSVAVASLAQNIATSENRVGTVVEECFTAGLLHDIGKLVLLAEMPRESHELFRSGGGVQARERERRGCTHAEIGAYLMSIWGIPLPLVQAVAFHHHPSDAGDTQFSALTAVHAANTIACSNAALAQSREAEFDVPYLESLGFGDRGPAWRKLHDAPAAEPNALASSANV